MENLKIDVVQDGLLLTAVTVNNQYQKTNFDY